MNREFIRELPIRVRNLVRGLKYNKPAVASLVIISLVVFSAIFSPVLVDYSKLDVDYRRVFKPPSPEFPLGTDHMGRDILSQVALGARDVLLNGLLVSTIAILIGTLVGLVAGYTGGKVDKFLMTVTDVFILIPSFPLILILISIMGRMDLLTISTISAMTMWMGYARNLRARVLQIREMPFIEALVGLGMSKARILFTEVLPMVAPYMIVEYVRLIRGGIFVIVGLAFLGIAPWSPYNWGTMLNIAYFQARSIFIPRAFTHWLSPLVAIVIFQWALLNLARYLEEVLNPRLKEYE